ncbi:glycosyltransferase [Saccharopolyspora sp. HNM0983]|uniref:Glycosyltransferase n=1 Tax=Saccharopolyspora montiporae TaxID=2781240 RepID=A0A929G027_9PSEU|nr:glycosyltransferase family 2 protein [Saccharopolyspora sp. HNM0983]MBE9375155.1 glycosyltransferase [Saccharopolyspora sp. HNM0983]
MTGLLASAATGVVYRSVRTVAQTGRIVPLSEPPESPVEPPRVTVVVPARNEAAVLDGCLRGVLDQTHGAAGSSLLRAVVVDDGSTDGTGEIARAHAAADPRLTVERVDAPPAGWGGKVHAMHVGTESAAPPEPGEWLMFLDADTVPAPELVSRLVATAESADADLVSTPGGPPAGHSATWPLLMPSGLQLIGENADPNGRGRKAFAIGHCILVRRSHYEKVGGWQALADRRNEDIAIATLVRDSGGTTRTVDGLDHLTTSGMDPFQQGWSSFRKSFVAGTGGSAPVLAALGVGQVVASLAAPAAAIAGIRGGRRGLALLGAAGWLAQGAAHARTGRFMRAGRGVAALAPVSGALFGGLLLDGALRARRGVTSWKGRRTSI